MITNETLYTELVLVKGLLLKLLRKNNVEEISLNRACQLLHIGYDKAIELIQNKKLGARPVNSKHSRSGITYKIRISDIEEYQNKSQILYIKPIHKIIEEAQ